MTLRTEPSATMIEALVAMTQSGLVRHAGGYWAPPGASRDHNGIPRPCWGTPTIAGCVSRGLANYTEWKTGRNGDFPIRVEIEEPKQ